MENRKDWEEKIENKKNEQSEVKYKDIKTQKKKYIVHPKKRKKNRRKRELLTIESMVLLLA